MILSGNQPTYLPSMRLFNRIAHSDVYMHCPHLQYQRKSFQSHNFIKDAELCVDCHVPSTPDNPFPSIGEVMISGDHWRRKHLRAIKHDYCGARYFEQYYSGLALILTKDWRMLTLLNQALIEQICKWLELTTRIVDSANWHWTGDATDKNIQMCKIMGADVFLQSENAAKENGGYMTYAEIDRMAEAGIKVIWQKFKPVYALSRRNGGELSIIHHLFVDGPSTRQLVFDSGAIV